MVTRRFSFRSDLLPTTAHLMLSGPLSCNRRIHSWRFSNELWKYKLIGSYLHKHVRYAIITICHPQAPQQHMTFQILSRYCNQPSKSARILQIWENVWLELCQRTSKGPSAAVSKGGNERLPLYGNGSSPWFWVSLNLRASTLFLFCNMHF